MDQIKFCFLLKLPGFAVLGCGTGVGGGGGTTHDRTVGKGCQPALGWKILGCKQRVEAISTEWRASLGALKVELSTKKG